MNSLKPARKPAAGKIAWPTMNYQSRFNQPELHYSRDGIDLGLEKFNHWIFIFTVFDTCPSTVRTTLVSPLPCRLSIRLTFT
jgi:hypothetical protein